MKLIANNKKAYFEYFIEDTILAGIVLEGSEVKSIREGHMSILDSYATVKNGEIFLMNSYIKPYAFSTIAAPEERRSRKLLLKKAEIKKLIKKKDEKGYTLVPTKVLLNRGLVKIEIGIGKGKKLHDKRRVTKERDVNREIHREMKNLKY